MNTITIAAVINEDRHLVIDLPPETPPVNAAREAARAKFIAAGALSTTYTAPEGVEPLTVEERTRIGQLPPNARPSEELIDEDRGEY